jgi:hypothetical protein
VRDALSVVAYRHPHRFAVTLNPVDPKGFQRRRPDHQELRIFVGCAGRAVQIQKRLLLQSVNVGTPNEKAIHRCSDGS